MDDENMDDEIKDKIRAAMNGHDVLGAMQLQEEMSEMLGRRVIKGAEKGGRRPVKKAGRVE